MTYPTLVITPGFPVQIVESRSVVQERPEDAIVRFRQDTYPDKTVRAWHIVIPILPRAERVTLKAAFVAARGDAGAMLWTPPGETTPIAVKFGSNSLHLVDVNAIRSAVEFELVEFANPTE